MKLIFLIMVLVSSLGQLTSDLYLPSLPAIAIDLHSNNHAAQWTLSIYMLGFAITQLLYGPISDGVGRRKPLLLGLMLGLVGGVMCFFAHDIQALMIGRLIQGVGAGATLSLPAAILRDIFEGKNLAKYSSYAGLISAGVLAMGPLLGGYVQEYCGWRADFILLMVYSLIALIAVFCLVPETNTHTHPENLRPRIIKQNLSTLFVSPIFIGYCACSLFAYGAILAWLTSGPIVLQTVVGLSPVSFGWLYILTGIAFSLGAFSNGKAVGAIGIERMLRFGLMIILLAGVLMAGFKFVGYVNAVVIMLPVLLVMFGASWVFPNSSAGIFQPFPKIAGTAAAIFYSARVLAGSIFSGLVAWMPSHSQLPMAFAFMLSALLALGVFYFTIGRRQQ